MAVVADPGRTRRNPADESSSAGIREARTASVPSVPISVPASVPAVMSDVVAAAVDADGAVMCGRRFCFSYRSARCTDTN